MTPMDHPVISDGSGSDSPEVLLKTTDLQVHFPILRGIVLRKEVGAVKAVDGVSFEILKGETLGLVGESGCGKTTIGRAILQLTRPTGGEVHFKGHDLMKVSHQQMRQLRREMQMVYQDPYASLNPRMSVGASFKRSICTERTFLPL